MFWRFDTNIGRSVPYYLRFGQALYMTPRSRRIVQRFPFPEDKRWTPA